ncbi:acyltransferase [Phascolarctobacterium succinatutens]|uniref:acyltransferase n=1 Tax=Phascolarctobacterium succinatutens TaxID=626940 RepID=UPI0023F1C686|nr:acyltransferase [Phascolarctobacterium succinatutens]
MCELQTRTNDSVINIGNNVLTNNNLKIIARGTVDIGDDCLIGENVTIMDHNAHGVKPSERRTSAGTVKDVIIGKNVWIGNNVTILPGSIIGDNCILAVGCVVKGNIPANVIVQGNPGVIVKNINC